MEHQQESNYRSLATRTDTGGVWFVGALILAVMLAVATPLLAIAGSWDLVPGWAIDVGDGWVIGHAQSGGGKQIFRWNGQGWDLMPGGAVRIGGTYSTPWIVNSSKQIFRWNGSAWDLVSGWAIDVGDGWVIGHAQSGGGKQIFRWNGQGWDLMPGGAVGIGGTYSAPWIVNSSKQIFRWKD